MTDAELFAAAAEHAKSVAYWRLQAATAQQRQLGGEPLPAFDPTRRQCLTRVRYGQARIVDLAIVAEQRAMHATRSATGANQ